MYIHSVLSLDFLVSINPPPSLHTDCQPCVMFNHTWYQGDLARLDNDQWKACTDRYQGNGFHHQKLPPFLRTSHAEQLWLLLRNLHRRWSCQLRAWTFQSVTLSISSSIPSDCTDENLDPEVTGRQRQMCTGSIQGLASCSVSFLAWVPEEAVRGVLH